MTFPGTVLWLTLGFAFLGCSSAAARPVFFSSTLEGRGSKILVADLDGDGLKDVVLVDGLKLSIFYQDPKRGFTRKPEQTCHLEHEQCVLWAAGPRGRAESLFVMSSDGVSELSFTNRTGPPVLRNIIRQATILPAAGKDTNVIHASFSVPTGGDRPLLLVPAPDGLQVWSAFRQAAAGRPPEDRWRRVQVIDHSVISSLWPRPAAAGYIRAFELDLSVEDVNGDGRGDLMVRQGHIGGTNTYTLYLQQTNGRFDLEPAFRYADKVEWHTWLCWADFNHDGRVDLLKSIWLNEPSFVPGVPSGKVVVAVYIANAHGSIPAKPQAVFRKNDWIAWLPVLDVDGDGFQDLALGYSDMDSKESLLKEITARELDYSLRLYFYRPGTGFPREPDCRRDVVIRLERPETLVNWSLPLNFVRCVRLAGDFNGDGKTDLLVQGRRDAISVYFFISRARGFSREPNQRFACREPITDWQVADLNGDGISDLIARLGNEDGFRIFISRK